MRARVSQRARKVLSARNGRCGVRGGEGIKSCAHPADPLIQVRRYVAQPNSSPSYWCERLAFGDIAISQRVALEQLHKRHRRTKDAISQTFGVHSSKL